MFVYEWLDIWFIVLLSIAIFPSVIVGLVYFIHEVIKHWNDED